MKAEQRDVNKSFDEYRQIIGILKSKIEISEKKSAKLQITLDQLKGHSQQNFKLCQQQLLLQNICKIQARIRGFLTRTKLEQNRLAPQKKQLKYGELTGSKCATFEESIHLLQFALERKIGFTMEMVFRALDRRNANQIDIEEFKNFFRNLKLKEFGVTEKHILKVALLCNEDFKPCISKYEFINCLSAYGLLAEKHSHAIEKQMIDTQYLMDLKTSQNNMTVRLEDQTFAQRVLLYFAKLLHDNRYSLLHAFNEIRLISNRNQKYITKDNLGEFILKRLKKPFQEKQLYALMSTLTTFQNRKGELENQKAERFLNQSTQSSQDNLRELNQHFFISTNARIMKSTFIIAMEKAFSILGYDPFEVDKIEIDELHRQGAMQSNLKLFRQNTALQKELSLTQLQPQNANNRIDDAPLNYKGQQLQKQSTIQLRSGSEPVTDEIQQIRKKIQKSGKPFYLCLEYLLLNAAAPAFSGYTTRQVKQAINHFYEAYLTSKEVTYLLKKMDANSDGTFDFEEIRIFFLNFCMDRVSLKLLLILFAKQLEILKHDTLQEFVQNGVEEIAMLNLEEFLLSVAPILNLSMSQANLLFLELIREQEYATLPLKMLVEIINSYRIDHLPNKEEIIKQKADDNFQKQNADVLELKAFLSEMSLSPLQLFDELDMSQKGVIPLIAIKNRLLELAPFKEKQIYKWLNQLDINNNGLIERRELDLLLMTDKQHKVTTPARSLVKMHDRSEILDLFMQLLRQNKLTPKQFFDFLDQDKIGKIDLFELKKGLSALGQIDASHAVKALKVFDLDANGVIDFQEFSSFFPESLFFFDQTMLANRRNLGMEYLPPEQHDIRVELRNKAQNTQYGQAHLIQTQDAQKRQEQQEQEELAHESELQKALKKFKQALQQNGHATQLILNRTFGQFDRDQNKLLSREEFIFGLDQLDTNIHLTQAQKVLLLEQADKDRSNSISMQEFLSFVESIDLEDTNLNTGNGNANQYKDEAEYVRNIDRFVDQAQHSKSTGFIPAINANMPITEDLLDAIESNKEELVGIPRKALLFRILASCIVKNEEFTDPDFPPIVQSICMDVKHRNYRAFKAKAVWARPHEIFRQILNSKDPYLQIPLFDCIEPNDIKQGRLIDNSSFLASVSTMAELPHLIRSVFMSEVQNKQGVYGALLFIQGVPSEILVDDKVPCFNSVEDAEGENIQELQQLAQIFDKFPMFTKPNGKELWVLILEKAWSKVIGSYQLTEFCSVKQAMECLLKSPSKEFKSTRDPIFKNQHNMAKFLLHSFKQQYLMTASSRSHIQLQQQNQNQNQNQHQNQNQQETQVGTILGQSYSVLAVYRMERTQETLIKMRASTGKFLFKGKYAFASFNQEDNNNDNNILQQSQIIENNNNNNNNNNNSNKQNQKESSSQSQSQVSSKSQSKEKSQSLTTQQQTVTLTSKTLYQLVGDLNIDEGVFLLTLEEFIASFGELTVSFYKQHFLYDYLLIKPAEQALYEDDEVQSDLHELRKSRFEGFLQIEVCDLDNLVCLRLHQKLDVVMGNTNSNYRYALCDFQLYRVMTGKDHQVSSVQCIEVGSQLQFVGTDALLLNDNIDPFIILKPGSYFLKYRAYPHPLSNEVLQKRHHEQLAQIHKSMRVQRQQSLINFESIHEQLEPAHLPIVISCYSQFKILWNGMDQDLGKQLLHIFYMEQGRNAAEIVDEVNSTKFACVEVQGKYVVYLENNSKKGWTCHASIRLVGLNNLRLGRRCMAQDTDNRLNLIIKAQSADFALLHTIDKAQPIGFEKVETEFAFQQ